MKNINIYIPDASRRLQKAKGKIEESIHRSLKQISNFIEPNNIDLLIINNKRATIPEIGLGGHALNEYSILISLNAERIDFNSVIENYLPSTLAHEISHIIRMRKNGYSKNLLDALIFEGLGDWFDYEVFGKSAPIWSKVPISNEVFKLAQESYFIENYNHEKWFFRGNREIPRWTGYTLGYNLVENYLKRTNRKPSQLLLEPAEKFI